ncbi:chloride channel protein [Streptomyces sp. WAC06614]|uniref:chloride channel protein n=1 Tax=Streptomyces sp. WAC06614 TaxID=2487416 RepID=UPI000F79BB74|nr:chloride channel protein [Streptomyces sp. WAC06614]RSS80077.1 chloride channel protein [Streptomyces sp. WAC06614]
MPGDDRSTERWFRFGAVAVVVGVGAGVGGALLVLLLHVVQHTAFGYTEGSFLSGVEAASPVRRLVVTTSAGVVAGLGWWLLHRYGRPLVGIEDALSRDRPRMPPLTTVTHAVLQIVTIGLGSPLGREVAPRQVAAVLADGITRRTGLSPHRCRILLACAAGAGLAAVYDVPLGGAVFTLEVLLGTWAPAAAVPALLTAGLATLVARAAVPDEPVYRLPDLDFSSSLLVWAVLVGPLAGAYAYGFSRLAAAAGRRAPRGTALLLTAPAAFLCVGLLAVPFPQLLGNGKGPAEVAFTAQPALALAVVLLVLRTVIVPLCLWSGAYGGLLTPSFANGALLGIIAGRLWEALWPGTTLGAYAVVAAGAFLAAAQRMPVTAVVLAVEFTAAPRGVLVPLLLAVVGASATAALLRRARTATAASPG